MLVCNKELDDRRLWCLTILCVLELRPFYARLTCTANERGQLERFKLGSERRTATTGRGCCAECRCRSRAAEESAGCWRSAERAWRRSAERAGGST